MSLTWIWPLDGPAEVVPLAVDDEVELEDELEESGVLVPVETDDCADFVRFEGGRAGMVVVEGGGWGVVVVVVVV